MANGKKPIAKSFFEAHKHCVTPPELYSENYDIASYWQFGVLPFADITFYYNFSCPEEAAQLLFSHPGITPQHGKAIITIVEAGGINL